MTQLLEQAILKLQQLPETEQDAIATMILEELEDEAQWNQAFAKSQDLLAKLAEAALAEDNTGKNIAKIEAAILQLSPEEFQRLSQWFSDLDYQKWDEKLEKDVAEGKLDALAAEALANFEAGNYQEI